MARGLSRLFTGAPSDYSLSDCQSFLAGVVQRRPVANAGISAILRQAVARPKELDALFPVVARDVVPVLDSRLVAPELFDGMRNLFVFHGSTMRP
jgi:hypothetical protein